MDIRLVDSHAWISEIVSIVSEGKDAPLIVTGNSMAPFLKHGRDEVLLRAPSTPVKKGDILLYRRRNGAYILHRAVRTKGTQFWCAGDAQQAVEGPLDAACVLAVAVRVRRKGKWLSPKSITWQFFEKLWPLTRPFRSTLRKVHMALHGVFTHLKV